MSRAQSIAGVLLSRLATITQANGYATNAGLHVFDGAAGVPGDLGAFLVLAELEEGVASQKAGDGQADDVTVSQPYTVEGRTACDPLHPNTAGRLLVSDIQRAIFGAGSKLPAQSARLLYTGRTISPRDPGAAEVVVTVTLQAAFAYSLGNP